MPAIGFPNFGNLDAFTPIQQAQLQQFIAYLVGWLSQEHKGSGAHSAITADSVTHNTDGYINGTGELDLRVNGTQYWTIESDGDLVPVATATQDLGSASLVVENGYIKSIHFGNPASGVLDASNLTFIGAAAIASGGSSNLSVTAAGTGTLTLTDGSNGGLVKLQTSGGSSRIQWASNENTGAGAAALGANCPAVTAGAPYTWLKLRSADGSDVYIPAWK